MTQRPAEEKQEDPGVPEALPRTLFHARARLGAERTDAVWVFPPIKRGRRERGLVAVSLFLDGDERRRILTVSYTAERTGRSLTVDRVFHEEGDAPPELLPRVMEGVVRRAGEGHGEPRLVEVGGDPGRFQELLDEFDPVLLIEEPA